MATSETTQALLAGEPGGFLWVLPFHPPTRLICIKSLERDEKLNTKIWNSIPIDIKKTHVHYTYLVNDALNGLDDSK